MRHLQVSLSSQASEACITSKRRARHLQVTDSFEGSEKVFSLVRKIIFTPEKNYHEGRCTQKRRKTKKWSRRCVDNEAAMLRKGLKCEKNENYL